jgi:hypothetical protein
MRLIRFSAIWAAIALGVGLFVLVGYFIELDFVQEYRLIFMRWAVLLAAAALLVGLVNLAAVHWRRVSLTENGWIYSAVLLLAFLATLIIAAIFGPDSELALFIFNHLQLPLEASLMALLAVTLLVAGFRLLARRRDLYSIVFIGVAFVILLGTAPLPGADAPVRNELMLRLGNFRNWISQVVAAGAARGIVLGVALGAITTGLRVLLAADRPYGT